MEHIQIAFYKGKKKLFNRLVSWWTKGKYSHCELIIDEPAAGYNYCWSSSFSDKGVRLKLIKLKPSNWDVVTVRVAAGTREQAEQWFISHQGKGYDLLGLLGFIWRPFTGDNNRWFCSEAVAASIGITEPWRYSPNDLYAAVSRDIVEGV